MTRFEKWAVWTTTAATALTGIGFFGVKYLLEAPDPWAVVNHPLEPWLLKAHILVAPAMVFAIGLITMRHIWAHLRSGTARARRSGIFALVIGGPMVVSGYLIQTVAHAGALRALAIAHIATGLLFCIGFLAHQLAATARRGRARSSSPRRPGSRPAGRRLSRRGWSGRRRRSGSPAPGS